MFSNWPTAAKSAAFGLVVAAVAFQLALFGVLAPAVDRIRISGDRQIVAMTEQISTRFDTLLIERWREMALLRDFARETKMDPSGLRRTLTAVLSRTRQYAWLGVTDRDGRVIAASAGTLEGISVAQRPWFIEGLERPNVQDLHEAALLGAQLGATGEAFHLYDIATPVWNLNGEVVGVVGGHLSWTWVDQLRIELMRGVVDVPGLEVQILDKTRRVIIGPDVGSRLEASSLPQNELEADSVQLKGRSYRASWMATKPSGDFPGFGWIVVVRAPNDPGFDALGLPWRWSMISIALSLALAALLAAGIYWIAKPLHALVDVTRNLAAGRDEGLSALRGAREVREVALALRTYLRRYGEQLNALAAERDRDVLTGALNRRGFYGEVATRVEGVGERESLWFVVADIDHFKSVNDRFGHSAGDLVLRRVADLLREEIGPSGILGRVGGEEFLACLHAEEASAAVERVEAMRRRIESEHLVIENQRLFLTVSFGCAAWRRGWSVDKAFERADAALYEGKRGGRNRTVLAPDPSFARALVD